jgi:hypothetical protein
LIVLGSLTFVMLTVGIASFIVGLRIVLYFLLNLFYGGDRAHGANSEVYGDYAGNIPP